VTDPLSSLLRAAHLMSPSRLATTVATHGRALGVAETVLYLADYEQVALLPVPGDGVPERQELPIEGTMAGRSFRRVEVLTSSAGPAVRMWLPLLDGVERLGVVELTLASTPDEESEERLKAFVSLVAELVVTKDAYSDVFSRLRRRKTLSLAAEMQWELLPPPTFGTERVVITGGLEPAYDVGGDSFDYAVNGNTADLLVIDSVGHGLPAAVLASVAISAYRHARRNMLELPEIAAEVNAAVAGQFPGSQFATAVIARLDIDTGRLRWINAGHRGPLAGRGVLRRAAAGRLRPLGVRGRGPGTGDRTAADAQRAGPPGRPAAGRRQHRRPGVAHRGGAGAGAVAGAALERCRMPGWTC
jgi:hypothetical protein